MTAINYKLPSTLDHTCINTQIYTCTEHHKHAYATDIKSDYIETCGNETSKYLTFCALVLSKVCATDKVETEYFSLYLPMVIK